MITKNQRRETVTQSERQYKHASADEYGLHDDGDMIENCALKTKLSELSVG